MAGELKAGRYQIEQELGRGGMGVVYRARDTRLGRTVALKLLPAELMHDPELRRRLAQEARAASALAHPGVATVYDYIEADDESFIVFEYVEGTTLRERLGRHRFSTEELLDLGVQMAEALAAAHERGVTHRDLKPENIMLAPAVAGPPRAKVLDFGLAKLRQPVAATSGSASGAGTASLATTPGLLVGTVNYMAPEQLEGEPADARSDLHAAGLVLYEMATGINPFVGKTSTSTIANILKMPPPAVTERNPAAPAELDRILRKCLRKRPDERYQSARELLVDLANLRRDLAAPAAAEPGPAAAVAVPAEAPTIARGLARGLFILIQVTYLVMYGVAFYHFTDFFRRAEALGSLEWVPDYARLPFIFLGVWLVLAALCGPPLRFYLLSSTALDYSDLGRKFRWLFPAVLVADLAWATSPLLLLDKLGGLVFAASAALAYLPFSQRWLIYQAYSRQGGRSSSIQAPNSTGPRNSG